MAIHTRRWIVALLWEFCLLLTAVSKIHNAGDYIQGTLLLNPHPVKITQENEHTEDLNERVKRQEQMELPSSNSADNESTSDISLISSYSSLEIPASVSIQPIDEFTRSSTTILPTRTRVIKDGKTQYLKLNKTLYYYFGKNGKRKSSVEFGSVSGGVISTFFTTYTKKSSTSTLYVTSTAYSIYITDVEENNNNNIISTATVRNDLTNTLLSSLEEVKHSEENVESALEPITSSFITTYTEESKGAQIFITSTTYSYYYQHSEDVSDLGTNKSDQKIDQLDVSNVKHDGKVTTFTGIPGALTSTLKRTITTVKFGQTQILTQTRLKYFSPDDKEQIAPTSAINNDNNNNVITQTYTYYKTYYKYMNKKRTQIVSTSIAYSVIPGELDYESTVIGIPNTIASTFIVTSTVINEGKTNYFTYTNLKYNQGDTAENAENAQVPVKAENEHNIDEMHIDHTSGSNGEGENISDMQFNNQKLDEIEHINPSKSIEDNQFNVATYTYYAIYTKFIGGRKLNITSKVLKYSTIPSDSGNSNTGLVNPIEGTILLTSTIINQGHTIFHTYTKFNKVTLDNEEESESNGNSNKKELAKNEQESSNATIHNGMELKEYRDLNPTLAQDDGNNVIQTYTYMTTYYQYENGVRRNITSTFLKYSTLSDSFLDVSTITGIPGAIESTFFVTSTIKSGDETRFQTFTKIKYLQNEHSDSINSKPIDKENKKEHNSKEDSDAAASIPEEVTTVNNNFDITSSVLNVISTVIQGTTRIITETKLRFYNHNDEKTMQISAISDFENSGHTMHQENTEANVDIIPTFYMTSTFINGEVTNYETYTRAVFDAEIGELIATKLTNDDTLHYSVKDDKATNKIVSLVYRHNPLDEDKVANQFDMSLALNLMPSQTNEIQYSTRTYIYTTTYWKNNKQTSVTSTSLSYSLIPIITKEIMTPLIIPKPVPTSEATMVTTIFPKSQILGRRRRITKITKVHYTAIGEEAGDVLPTASLNNDETIISAAFGPTYLQSNSESTSFASPLVIMEHNTNIDTNEVQSTFVKNFDNKKTKVTQHLTSTVNKMLDNLMAEHLDISNDLSVKITSVIITKNSNNQEHSNSGVDRIPVTPSIISDETISSEKIMNTEDVQSSAAGNNDVIASSFNSLITSKTIMSIKKTMQANLNMSADKQGRNVMNNKTIENLLKTTVISLTGHKDSVVSSSEDKKNVQEGSFIVSSKIPEENIVNSKPLALSQEVVGSVTSSTFATSSSSMTKTLSTILPSKLKPSPLSSISYRSEIDNEKEIFTILGSHENFPIGKNQYEQLFTSTIFLPTGGTNLVRYQIKEGITVTETIIPTTGNPPPAVDNHFRDAGIKLVEAPHFLNHTNTGEIAETISNSANYFNIVSSLVPNNLYLGHYNTYTITSFFILGNGNHVSSKYTVTVLNTAPIVVMTQIGPRASKAFSSSNFVSIKPTSCLTTLPKHQRTEWTEVSIVTVTETYGSFVCPVINSPNTTTVAYGGQTITITTTIFGTYSVPNTISSTPTLESSDSFPKSISTSSEFVSSINILTDDGKQFAFGLQTSSVANVLATEIHSNENLMSTIDNNKMNAVPDTNERQNRTVVENIIIENNAEKNEDKPNICGESSFDCKDEKFEICQQLSSSEFRCLCRVGFARKNNHEVCQEIKMYSFLVPLSKLKEDKLSYQETYKDSSSEDYKRTADKAKALMEETLSNSKYKNSFYGTNVLNITDAKSLNQGDGVLLNYSVAMDSKQTINPQELEGIINTVKTNADTNSDPQISDLESLKPIPLKVCSDIQFNDCDKNAECEDLGGYFTCHCKESLGFIDVSPANINGRLCIEQCPCQNGGYCNGTDSDHSPICVCPYWKIGYRCQYNGLALAIALPLIFGLLLILCLILLCCCCCYRTKRSSKSPTKRTTYEYFGRVDNGAILANHPSHSMNDANGKVGGGIDNIAMGNASILSSNMGAKSQMSDDRSGFGSRYPPYIIPRAKYSQDERSQFSLSTENSQKLEAVNEAHNHLLGVLDKTDNANQKTSASNTLVMEKESKKTTSNIGSASVAAASVGLAAGAIGIGIAADKKSKKENKLNTSFDETSYHSKEHHSTTLKLNEANEHYHGRHGIENQAFIMEEGHPHRREHEVTTLERKTAAVGKAAAALANHRKERSQDLGYVTAEKEKRSKSPHHMSKSSDKYWVNEEHVQRTRSFTPEIEGKERIERTRSNTPGIEGHKSGSRHMESSSGFSDYSENWRNGSKYMENGINAETNENYIINTKGYNERGGNRYIEGGSEYNEKGGRRFIENHEVYNDKRGSKYFEESNGYSEKENSRYTEIDRAHGDGRGTHYIENNRNTIDKNNRYKNNDGYNERGDYKYREGTEISYAHKTVNGNDYELGERNGFMKSESRSGHGKLSGKSSQDNIIEERTFSENKLDRNSKGGSAHNRGYSHTEMYKNEPQWSSKQHYYGNYAKDGNPYRPYVEEEMVNYESYQRARRHH